jgi:hypothetical protein
MKNRTPKPPTDLSKAARQFSAGLQAEYDITTVAGVDLLTDAVRSYDRREQFREAIRSDDPTLKDGFGRTIAHPCVRIERDAAASLMGCVKALNLRLEPLRDKQGRPGGR